MNKYFGNFYQTTKLFYWFMYSPVVGSLLYAVFQVQVSYQLLSVLPLLLELVDCGWETSSKSKCSCI